MDELSAEEKVEEVLSAEELALGEEVEELLTVPEEFILDYQSMLAGE